MEHTVHRDMFIFSDRAIPKYNEFNGPRPQLELIVFMEGSLFDMKSFTSEKCI